MPWNGVTLAETADALYTDDPDDAVLTSEECTEFLRELRGLYKSSKFSSEHIRQIFGGLRPVSPAAETAYRDGAVQSDAAAH